MASPEIHSDPNLVLPPAVRAAAARSEQLMKLANPEGTDGDASSNPPEPPAEPVVTAPAEPQALEATTPPAPPPPAPDKTLDWERRYGGLKGRYDELQNTARSMQAQIDVLNETLDLLRRGSPQPAAEAPKTKLVTSEDEEAYGTEFLDVVARKAREEVSPEVSRLNQELEAIKSSLKGVTAVAQKSERERFHSDMDHLAPEWRDLNNNDDFLDWLELPDVYSGATRNELLRTANGQNDANRVAAFFKGFLAERAAVGPAGSEPHASTQSKVPLESLAAPGRARTAAAPSSAPAEKPVITRAFLAKFYTDKTAGRYKGRESELQRIEAEIGSALAEGRIR